MVGAVVQRCAQPDHRVTGERTFLHALAQALFHRREEVPRHRAAHDALAELHFFAVARLELDPDVAVLAVAAGLLFIFSLHLHLLSNRFPIGDAGIFQHDLHAELLFQLGGDDVQVLLANAGKDHLVRLRVRREVDRRIFLLQTDNPLRNLILLPLVLRQDCFGKSRRRVIHTRELHLAERGAERIAGFRVLELRHRADVARADVRHVLLLFSAHPERLAHADLFAGPRVDELAVSGDLPRDHLDIGKLADEGIGHGFENHRGGLVLVVYGDLDGVPVLVLPYLRRLFRGGRRQPGQAVEKLIDPVQQKRVPAENRRNGAGLHALADADDDLLRGKLFPGEILFEHLVARFGHRLVDSGAQAVQPRAHIRHLDLHGLALPVFVRFILQHIDVNIGLAAAYVRNDDRTDGRAERSLQALKHLVKVSAFIAEAVHEKDFGKLSGLRDRESFFRADAHAVFSGNRNQRGVGCAHRFAYAAGEIEQPGGVQQVDLIVFPFQRGNGGRHGTLPADLLRVEIGDGRPVAHPAQAVGSAGEVQHRFGQSRFARAAVAGQRNVQDVGSLVLFHQITLLSRLKNWSYIKHTIYSTDFITIIA